MENLHLKEKWQNVFSQAITKIQQARRATLTLDPDALVYLNKLLLRLLSTLVNPIPKNIQDAQDQIGRKFPEPLLSSWVLEESNKRGKKKGYMTDKVHHIFKDSTGSADKQVSIFLASVLEYMLSDILNLTGNYVENISNSRKEIKEQDIKIAIFADKVLVNLFHEGEDEDAPILPENTATDDAEEENYSTLLRILISEEQRYLRDLQLIIKLIKKAFTDLPKLFTESDIYLIFGNIEDIAELSAKLIVMLEEASEMTDELNPIPQIGNCFEELAEEYSFDLYTDYVRNMMDYKWKGKYDAILQQANINAALKTKYEGFREVVTYVLPHLLLIPIYHCFFYFEHIQAMERTATDEEDRECFSQTMSLVSPVKRVLEEKAGNLPKQRPSESSLRKSYDGGNQAEKMREIEGSIEGWVGKTITQSCRQYIHEGSMTRITGKKSSERKVFLFDNLLVCCKSNQLRRPMPTVATHEYRLKERILLRKTTVEDDESNPLQFTVCEEDTRHLFMTNTSAEKELWMSHLVRLQYRSIYDRMLNQLMRKEASQQPLRIPDKEIYRFAEPDLPGINLVEDKTAQPPIIKGGTVLKLVERLTYHLYYDSGFTKTFLTTFRSFCKPQRLLDLLIERFNIPEPPPLPDQQEAIDRGEIVTREDLKRFRKEYLKPIQLRVMNVLRQWLEHHWYDFETDSSLLEQVKRFVASVRGKDMQKWTRTMSRIIMKKEDTEEDLPIPLSFAEDAPPVEWHLTHDKEKYNIMTLHPIEIARQLTLMEFDLYKKVQPSELVGTVWTKADKATSSPNLLNMIHCSTKISRWIKKAIVETKNFEERAAVMSRAVEIMQVLKQLNNFNGILEFVAAFNSSPIYRLNHTKQHLNDRLLKVRTECMDMCDPRQKKCLELLRSCDPPCVPFVGTFLTNILKTEEGNPHLLPNFPQDLELINFAKRRMVAAILFDIQQYQNQPYNLIPVPEIQEYLSGLKPLGDQTEKQFNDYLFALSQEIEPRGAERPARFPKLSTDKEIKSPGIAPSKKTQKSLHREESRMSLFGERRNSAAEDDAQKAPEKTPEPPKTPTETEPKPPPRPPRQPIMTSLVSAPPIMGQNHGKIFNFDERLDHPPLLRGSSELIPPPLPPRDPIFHPQPLFQQVEPERFGNEEIFSLHHQGAAFPFENTPEQLGFPQAPIMMEPHFEPNFEPQQNNFGSQFHPSGAPPPVPPRDPPSLPPRGVQPPFESYYRYVPDPTRFVTHGNDTPPPIPRRQPSIKYSTAE